MKWSAFASLGLLIISLLPGCSATPSTSEGGKSGDTTVNTTAKVRSAAKGDLFSTRLKEYLDKVSVGGDGREFWCQKKEGAEKKLFAVQSYKVLEAKPSALVNGFLYTVQVHSSTQGGVPVTKNWLIFLDTETNGTACVEDLIDNG